MCRKEVKMKMGHTANQVLLKNKGKKGNCHLDGTLLQCCNLQLYPTLTSARRL